MRRELFTVVLTDCAGGAVHELAVWRSASRWQQHTGCRPLSAGGECPSAAALGVRWSRRWPAHPGCLRGGQGSQGAGPGIPSHASTRVAPPVLEAYGISVMQLWLKCIQYNVQNLQGAATAPLSTGSELLFPPVTPPWSGCAAAVHHVRKRL
ncbi:hypothetical protein V5799_025073 [Amblyomma americanum]|uniref:Uncharacterized protein n=1 Tax=Amblyomma americanum TaxID=6943 RepID=A0AAQ4EAA4_AMBAM